LLSHAELVTAAPLPRPNIVVVLVDDMGFSDIGCFGSEIPTPNLDRLAADGLRFTQFYNTPRCSPTRAALLTGLYPHQAGMGWLDDKVEPRSQGFHGKLLPRKDSPELGKDWYSTDLFTDWGLKFIDEARAERKPFFLYIAQGVVHFPLRAPADAIARYRGKYMQGWDQLREERHARQLQMGIVDARWPLSRRPDESPAWETLDPDRQKRFDQIMSVYAAMIDCLDHSMGRLVAGLKERGL
jgi:arylsulfatase